MLYRTSQKKFNTMQQQIQTPSDISNGNGLAHFNQVEKFDVADDFIRQAVDQADLPALLATLAMITGDTSLISEDLKPPTPRMTTAIAPQGGMSAQAQEKARRLATSAIIKFRDAGQTAPTAPSPSLIDQCVAYLVRGDLDELRPLLEHELSITRDMGAPDWKLGDIAPHRRFRVAVIGAGVSGIASAYRLQQAGVDFSVFEKNEEVGGVWWENRYPGCRLDTPNFAYSLSFAQKPDWPQQFSRQPEIQAYLQKVTGFSGVRSHIQFNTEIDAMRFDEASGCWTLSVRNSQGTVVEEEFNAVITAVGILNRPSFPDIPGIDTFKGQVIHSSKWPDSPKLEGKRVAMVGTGASAFQIGPSIASSVAQFTIFQRNPPWMLPTPTYHDDIKPGMQWLLKHVPFYGRWFRFWQFWIAVEGRLPLTEVDDGWDHPVSVGRANEELRQGCLAWMASQYSDRPDLLAKVTPQYAPAAKRMLRDNGTWATMLKMSHVELNTTGIQEMTATGIKTKDGVMHEFDAIVFATGFKASDFLSPMKITGMDGREVLPR